MLRSNNVRSPLKYGMRLACRSTFFLVVIALYCGVGLMTFGVSSESDLQVAGSSRRLLSDSSSGNFTNLDEACSQERVEADLLLTCNLRANPGRDAFTEEQIKGGAVAFYIMGSLYMFIALSIVCDEFFVPALEVIAEKTKMSNEVAGATLMAAGGSAPELFTSFIGTFQESSVGFGTIVGSAVFNVLFVIAMCAMFSTEVLALTWWPLFRDSIYYTLSLTMVAVFFSVVSPDEIELWEALVLFSMYIGYVLLMSQHVKVYNCIQRCRGQPEQETRLTRADSAVAVQDTELVVTPESNPATEEKEEKEEKEEWDEIMTHSGGPSLRQSIASRTPSVASRTRQSDKESTKDRKMTDHLYVGNQVPSFRRPSTFRAGIMQLMLTNKPILETAGVHVIHKIQGNASETFSKLDKDGNGCICRAELAELLQSLGHPCKPEDVDSAMKSLDQNGDGKITFDEFQHWYTRSEQRIEAELEEAFLEIDVNHSRDLDLREVQIMFFKLHPNLKDDELHSKAQELFKELDKKADEVIKYEEFTKWYHTSSLWGEKQAAIEKESDEAEGLSLEFPEGCRARLMYILLAPLTFTLVCTIPRMQKPEYRTLPIALYSFVAAIAWIGGYSYLMVWWVEVSGAAFSIPPVVMGLTFLAAGTSVPDLLSSVIVAKMGEGDMAVSSSLGSNIFDVLIGLPLPWLVYCMAKGKSVSVQAGNISLSIFILVGMLGLVILIVALSGWRMTKTLGVSMLVLYVVFVTQSLLRYFLI